MFKSIFSFLFFITLFSCSKERTKEVTTEPHSATPEVLNESKSDVYLNSVSKRYKSNIIEELYSEAMEKDATLSRLNERINRIGGVKSDSLEAYNKYIRNNEKYWHEVEQYLNNISDSTLKKETKNVFKVLEEKYNARISKHDSAFQKLENKTLSLEDQLALMKLLVTADMMTNYQRNELPKITTINSLSARYDSLIRETKTYTRIKK